MGIVLFERLKKLRIWYGDGGGEEWTGVDFMQSPITTSSQNNRSIVLSRDLASIIFNDVGEHAFGNCNTAPVFGAPLWWFNPTLTQGP